MMRVSARADHKKRVTKDQGVRDLHTRGIPIGTANLSTIYKVPPICKRAFTTSRTEVHGRVLLHGIYD